MLNHPPELFAEPPVRSSFNRRPPRRRFSRAALLLGGVLVLVVLGGVGFGLFEWTANDTPNVIPTIQATLPLKQKPDQPGGIDIPHQDVTVFQELDKTEKSTSDKKSVEHLLPPAQAPQSMTTETKAAVAPVIDGGEQGQVMGSANSSALEMMPAPEAAPAAVVTTTTSPVVETPVAVTQTKVDAVMPKDALAPAPVTARSVPVETAPKTSTVQGAPPVKETHVVKAAPVAKEIPVPKETKSVAPKASVASSVRESLPKELFTGDPERQIQKMEKVEKAVPVATPGAGGSYAVQFASLPNAQTADVEVKKIQSRYAALLGGKTLRVVRADLGAKGTYYRIQTPAALSETSARSLCASVKSQGGACLLAKH